MHIYTHTHTYKDTEKDRDKEEDHRRSDAVKKNRFCSQALTLTLTVFTCAVPGTTGRTYRQKHARTERERHRRTTRIRENGKQRK